MGIWKKVTSLFSQSETKQTRGYARRQSRLAIHELHQIFATIEKPVKIDYIPIRNITTQGAGLINIKEHLSLINPEDNIEGFFTISDQQYSFKGKIIHKTDELVGIKFDDSCLDLPYMITQYFDIERNADKMLEISPDALQQEQGIENHWFVSQNTKYDLFYSIKDRNVIRFRLTFADNFLLGEKDKPIRHGVVKADNPEEADHIGIKQVDMVQSTTNIPIEVKEKAIRVLKGINDLNKDHQNKLIELLIANN